MSIRNSGAMQTLCTSVAALTASTVLIALVACGEVAGSGALPGTGGTGDENDAASSGKTPNDANPTGQDGSVGPDGAVLGDGSVVEDGSAGPDGSVVVTTCTAPGRHCSAVACCEGTCDSKTDLCGNGPGGYCNPSAFNPDAYCLWGSTCDVGASKCVAMACIDAGHFGVCSQLSDLGCCDSRLHCTKIAAGTVDTCCAPNGTTLPASEASKCCEGSAANGADVTCIPRKGT